MSGGVAEKGFFACDASNRRHCGSATTGENSTAKLVIVIEKSGTATGESTAVLEVKVKSDIPAGIELPLGVSSVEEWGMTVVAFGKTHNGKSYAEVVNDVANRSYLNWVRSHAKSGALLDFLNYMRCVLPEECSSTKCCIPGTNIIRKLKPQNS